MFRASPTLVWDLGDTLGTVAVRMPLHPLALEVLRQTGPLAVSSASLAGAPAATTVARAEAQLGGAVAVYLDAGPCAGNVTSTILDLTGTVPRMLRAGAIGVDDVPQGRPRNRPAGHRRDPRQARRAASAGRRRRGNGLLTRRRHA